MKKITQLLGLVFLSLLAAGCATSVPVTVTRPAELDLHGAKSISVLPFQLSTFRDKRNNDGGTTIVNLHNFFDMLKGDNPDEVAAANYLTSELTKQLSDSDYIQLVNSSAVQQAIEKGTSVPADVYLAGKISRFDSNVVHLERYREKEGKTDSVTYYRRDVFVSIMYQIIDAKTNEVIAYKTRDLKKSSGEFMDYDKLGKPFDIIRPDFDRLIKQILKELQPYQEIKHISLLADKTKDPDMKLADKLVKQGLIAQGEEKFLSLYQEKGYFTAGYNAAKLLQAEGKLQEAKELMTELVNKFDDKHAIFALSDIEYEISQAEKLEKQTSE